MLAIPEKTLVIGQLAGVFGVKGWLKIRSFTEPESNMLSYSPWWLKTSSGLKEVEVTDYQLRPQGLVVHFKGVDDRDIAAQFGKLQIHIATDLLPALAAGDYYLHQLFDLKVISVFSGYQNPETSKSVATSERLLGYVCDVMETGANDVLVVKPCEGSIDSNERLIPYLRDTYVVDICLEKGEMRVDWDPDF